MDPELPRALAEAVARITAPDPSTAAIPDDMTGVLGDLLRWWQTLSPGVVLTPVTLTSDASIDATHALAAGASAADRAIDAGATLLVPRAALSDQLEARSLIALLTRKDPSDVVDQPRGTTDREWMARCAAVRDRVSELTDRRGEPVALLAASPPGIGYVAGALLAGAARRTPALIDGTDELAAALVADRISYRAKDWWRAGSDSPDPGRRAAADRIELATAVPLGLTDDKGRGAQAAVAVLTMLLGEINGCWAPRTGA